MAMKSKTIFLIGAALALVWVGRKAAKTATAAIERGTAPIPGVNGLDGFHSRRPMHRPKLPSMRRPPWVKPGWAKPGTAVLPKVPGKKLKFGVLPGINGLDGIAKKRIVEKSVSLPMVINPYETDNAARVNPWWNDKEILGANAPQDPYGMQPINERGDVVNIGSTSPLNVGNVGEISQANHGSVAYPTQDIPYVEPGDESYGNSSTTDFSESSVASAYDSDPGVVIGLR